MAAISEPNPAHDFITPGEMLKKAREKSGVTLVAISKELNLSVTKLEALERDEYEKISSNVFALGYLRRFAKMVGVDEKEVVQSFNKYMAQMQATIDEITQAEETPKPKSVELPPKLFMPAIVFGVALVILVSVILLNQSEETEVVSAASAPNASIPADVRDVSQTIPFANEASLDIAEPSLPTETVPAAIVSDSSESASSNDEVAGGETLSASVAAGDLALTVEESRLAFTFIDDCWLKVTDANGKVIHAQLEKAGSSMTLSAQAPVEVMVGNARAVSLSFNGEFVAIEAIPGRTTAKMVLGNN